MSHNWFLGKKPSIFKQLYIVELENIPVPVAEQEKFIADQNYFDFGSNYVKFFLDLEDEECEVLRWLKENSPSNVILVRIR